jgi:transcriptional regulator GlxA family with amidase domain
MRTSNFARFTREEKAAVEAALRYLEEHLMERITVPGLSEQFGISEKKLQRAVKLRTGNTLYAYLLGLRINYAMQLLSTTDEPIKNVSRLAGMGDASHFGQMFRKLTGMSPQSYRSKHND